MIFNPKGQIEVDNAGEAIFFFLIDVFLMSINYILFSFLIVLFWNQFIMNIANVIQINIWWIFVSLWLIHFVVLFIKKSIIDIIRG